VAIRRLLGARIRDHAAFDFMRIRNDPPPVAQGVPTAPGQTDPSSLAWVSAPSRQAAQYEHFGPDAQIAALQRESSSVPQP